MTKPGPSVTSGADTQPGSDSLFPSGFGGGAVIRSGSVGTTEIADASVAAADLNLPSVAAALAARGEFTGAFASKGFATQSTATLATVTAIPNLKWCFTPETGFYSDQAGTTAQTTDGGAVKCWKDASPNADHATTSATGLTLALGAGAGCSGLNVAGNSTRLVTAGTFDSSFNAGWTEFVVAHDPTISTNKVVVSSGDSRFYHNRFGPPSGASFGATFSATSAPTPTIPTDIPTSTNTGAPKGNVMVECVRYSGPSQPFDAWFDGYHQHAPTASSTALALTGALNIGGLPGSFPWGGTILAYVAFNRALTDAEVQTVYNYLSGVTKSVSRPLIQCVGNSLTSGTGSSTDVDFAPGTVIYGYARPGGKNYPSRLAEMYPAGEVAVRPDAYPGRTNQQIAAELSRTSGVTISPAAHSKRVAVVWEVTNDLNQNPTANWNAIKAGNLPQAYSQYVANCATLKAQGWLVVAVTCLPRADGTTAVNDQFYEMYQHINRLLRANWPSFADGLADVAGDPRLGLPGCETNTTYFNADKIHLTDEGYRVVAGIVKRAVDPLIGGSGTPRPLLTKSVAGAVDVTLSDLEGATLTQLNGGGIVVLSGAITANINVILPKVEGARALFHNNTSGAFTVTLKSATGTGYAITQAKRAMAYCDGTNWYQGTPEV